VLLEPIAYRPLLTLGVLLTVLAMQFLSIGLIGELIVRVAGAGSRGAIYRVREELNCEPPEMV
jgi:hypothetical protein